MSTAALRSAVPDRQVLFNAGNEKSEDTEFQYCPPEVQSRLSVSKPVGWRGRGEVPQYPWSSVGTWLLVDLWSGIGGTILACLSLGLRVLVIAIEQDPVAAERAAQSFPNVISLQYVEDFKGSMLTEFLHRRTVEGVIIGGGSPCQGNSALNRHRRGLGDPRSHQPSELARIADEIAELPGARGLRIRTFLENVASSPRSVIKHYNELLEAKPLRIQASQFGWVQRNRLCWLGAREDFSLVRWPAGVGVRETDLFWDLVVELAKPVPPQVVLERGFTLRIDPKANLPDQRLPRIFTFTREFYHPLDSGSTGSAQAVSRFEADHRRFPVESYEEVSLAWKGNAWRTLTPDERALMHGIPPDAVGNATLKKMPESKRVQIRNCWIGNDFHIPSLVLVLWALVAEGCSLRVPLQCVSEQHLRACVSGSAFDTAVLQALHRDYEAHSFVQEVQSLFMECPGVLDAPWHKAVKRLQGCALEELLTYHAFLVHRVRTEFSQGPDWAGQRNRALLQASVGVQRAPGDSSKGLDHLFPPGLSKEEHIRRATQVPSPFSSNLAVDMDLQFAAYALGIWGPFLPQWQERTRRVLHRVVHALDAVEEHLASSSSVAELTVRKPLALVSRLWATSNHPASFVRSDRSCSCHMMRFLGTPAVEFVNDLLIKSPSKDAQAIWDLTIEEQTKGWCEGPFTRFVGNWRPVPRFLHVQPCGKQRLIDDARKGCHNGATEMTETIFTIGVDMWPVVARTMASEVLLSHGFGFGPVEDRTLAVSSLPPWFSLVASVMDLPDAYRACPVHPDHRRFTIVVIFDPSSRSWRFFKYTGLLYGLASAVLSFNRLPTLLVAAARRILALACGAYFDDIFDICIRLNAVVAQESLLHILQLAGAPPAPSKTQDHGPARVYLGALDLTRVEDDGYVVCGPTISAVQKVCAAVDQVRQTMSLTPAQAAKLRGQAGSLMHGKFGRLALNFLKERQYSKGGTCDVSPLQLRELQLLAHLVQEAPARCISVLGKPAMPVVVYSDASFEHNKAICGWVVFDGNQQPIGQTVHVTQEWIDSWKPRETQIFAAEAFCSLLVPFNLPESLRDRDVLWFVDNEAAAAAMILGSSGSRDVDMIVQLAFLQFHSLNCRIWVEWINSASNPSDGLSRGGLQDAWTLSQGWSLTYAFLPHPTLCETLGTLELEFGSHT